MRTSKSCVPSWTQLLIERAAQTYIIECFLKNELDHALIKGTYASRKRVEHTQSAVPEGARLSSAVIGNRCTLAETCLTTYASH